MASTQNGKNKRKRSATLSDKDQTNLRLQKISMLPEEQDKEQKAEEARSKRCKPLIAPSVLSSSTGTQSATVVATTLGVRACARCHKSLIPNDGAVVLCADETHAVHFRCWFYQKCCAHGCPPTWPKPLVIE
jgi:hypothetical protein